MMEDKRVLRYKGARIWSVNQINSSAHSHLPIHAHGFSYLLYITYPNILPF